MSVDAPDLAEEARSRQFLSFYQREMALYSLTHLDIPVAEYSIDRDLHPVFKVCALFPSANKIMACIVILRAIYPCLQFSTCYGMLSMSLYLRVWDM